MIQRIFIYVAENLIFSNCHVFNKDRRALAILLSTTEKSQSQSFHVVPALRIRKSHINV